MTELREVISRNFKKYRKQAKLSQTELARLLGISPSSVSNWEQGLNSIDIDTLFKACKILGVSISKMTETDENIEIDYTLKDDDAIVIETYRKLPDSEKAHLLAYAEFLYNQSNHRITEKGE